MVFIRIHCFLQKLDLESFYERTTGSVNAGTQRESGENDPLPNIKLLRMKLL